MESTDEIAFEIPTELSVQDIERVARMAWADAVKNDEELRDQLLAAGVNPETAEFPYRFDAQAGVIGTTLLLLMGTLAVKLGFKMATDIWDKIILPKLIDEYGRDCVKRKQA